MYVRGQVNCKVIWMATSPYFYEWNVNYSHQTWTLHPLWVGCSLSVLLSLISSSSTCSPSGRVRHRLSNSFVLSFVRSQACFQLWMNFLVILGESTWLGPILSRWGWPRWKSDGPPLELSGSILETSLPFRRDGCQ